MPQIGSPLQITALNGAPLLSNAYYTSAAARRGAGQARHESWPYYQEGVGYYQLLPLAQCFLSDGTTPATNRGSWGTLDAHWLFKGPRGPVPLDVRDFVVAGAFNGDSVMTTDLPADLAKLCEKGDFFTAGGYWFRYEFADSLSGLRWQKNYSGATVGASPGDGTTPPQDLSAYVTTAKLRQNLDLLPYTSVPKTYYVCGRGQTEPGVVGNPNRPFATIQAAHDAMDDALGLIRVMPGGETVDSLGRSAYNTDYVQTKHIAVYCEPGVILNKKTIWGGFDGTGGGIHYWYGGEFVNGDNSIMYRQRDKASQVLIENTRFSGFAGIQHVANNTGGGYLDLDVLTTRNCVFDSTRSTPPALEVNALRGPIRSNGRAEFGATIEIVLDNTIVITRATACISFSTVPGNLVTLHGTTDLRPGGGQPEVETIPNGQGTPAVALVDSLRDFRYSWLKGLFGVEGATLMVPGSAPRTYPTGQQAINAIPVGGYGEIHYNVVETALLTINKNCIIHAVRPLPTTRVSGTAGMKITINGNLRNTDDNQEGTFYWSGADVELNGDITHSTSNPTAAIIAYPNGKLKHRGNIYLNSTNSAASCFASSPAVSTADDPPFYDFKGNMVVTNKGALGGLKCKVYLEGFFFSKDQGFYSAAFQHDIRGVIDLRQSTNAKPRAITLAYGSFTPPTTTVHAGSSLLCPPNQDIFESNNPAVPQHIYLSTGVSVSKKPVSVAASGSGSTVVGSFSVHYIDQPLNIVPGENDGKIYAFSVVNGSTPKFTELT